MLESPTAVECERIPGNFTLMGVVVRCVVGMTGAF